MDQELCVVVCQNALQSNARYWQARCFHLKCLQAVYCKYNLVCPSSVAGLCGGGH